MIRIIIAEDQSMLRGALATLLSLEDDIDVIAEASDGDQALEKTLSQNPDVLVTDIEMPGRSGIDVAESLREQKHPSRVLIVTTFARPGYLQRAMQAGVSGYLLKDAGSEVLADAVRRVANGNKVVPPELSELAWRAPDPLTDRERDVLRLAEAGMSNKQIAANLELSPGTVRNYVTGAMDKLDATNRIEAFRIARDLGWL